MGKQLCVGMELGYWNCRGLAQPIRLLLEFCGEDYKETRYEIGDAPGYSQSEWTDVKDHLELAIPNLPYLVHGELRLTQSNAILRYLARMHGLVGENEQEQAR